MNYYQVVIFSASVWVATVIGWVRFKRIDSVWLPFIICLSLASGNELLSFFLTRNGHYTIINNNIYVLLEALLLVWQFRNWGSFNGRNRIFFILLLLITLAWIFENFISSTPFVINFYFRIIYSFIIVIMSININNTLILNYRKTLLTSPVFLVCSGFIIYFTYKILVEAFWLYGLNAGKDFRIRVYLLLTWINLFVNLIYALALLWIPKKPQHITLS